MGDLINFAALPDLSPMGQAALAYASYGFFVFPVWGVNPDHTCMCGEGKHCGSPGKHPIVKSGLNASTTSVEQITKWWRKHPLANIGVNCERSGLLVLDIDPRSGGDESLAKLEADNDSLPATYEVHTGGGGRHFYFRHTPVKSKQSVAPGVDVKSRGGYVVAPPSVHHSGGTYEAFHIGDPRGFLLDPPSWLVDLVVRDAKPEKPKPSPGVKPPKAADVLSGLFGAAFKHAGWLGEAAASGAYCARCPFDGEHTTGIKGSPSSSTVVFPPENGGVNGYVQCSHGHCSGRTQSDFWNAIPEASRDHAKKSLAISTLYDPAASSDPAWASSWRSELLFDNRGKLKQVKGNAAIILKNHPDFVGCLGHDTFSDKFYWLRSPPTPASLGTILPGPVQDKDFVVIAMYLAKKYDMQDYSDDSINSIMRACAVPFNPVRDYLESLVWDGRPRIMHWLHTYLGCPDTTYEQAVGSWWLVAAIARIFQPGCKADHVLILEGSQGTRKSTALSVLGSPWFADTPINLDSKDAYLALRGVWIYELQELASLSKADSDKAKSFFGSPKDTFRPPYGRNTVEFPRQCVFAGSVNHDAYLKDDTGNRRYHPVRTDSIDIDALRRDRDQLWAEALHAYRLGMQWEPRTEEEHELCRVEQTKRLQWEDDPWTTPVRLMVADRDDISAPDLASEIVGQRATNADAQRVARILRNLGLTKHHTNKGKLWRKPKS